MNCCVCNKPLIDLEQEQHCQKCAQRVCDICLRIPDPDDYPSDEVVDHCLHCYVRDGYADLWEVHYVLPQYGDARVTRIDVPPGTHQFKIPSMAGVHNYANKWHKI